MIEIDHADIDRHPAALLPVMAFPLENQPPKEPDTTTYQVPEAVREGNPILRDYATP